MGNKGSKSVAKLPSKQLKELDRKSNFNQTEIKLLWEHFCDIGVKSEDSKKKEVLIDLNGFKSLVGFTESKYVTRMFTLFDEDCDGSIQFSEFVSGLSALSDRGSFEEKLDLSFLIYDTDGDDKISRNELGSILVACLAENGLSLTPEQAKGCVDFTFRQLQVTGDHITKEEYKSFVRQHKEQNQHDLLALMSFNVTKRMENLQELRKAKKKEEAARKKGKSGY